MDNNELVTPHGLSFSGNVLAQRKVISKREMPDSSK